MGTQILPGNRYEYLAIALVKSAQSWGLKGNVVRATFEIGKYDDELLSVEVKPVR